MMQQGLSAFDLAVAKMKNVESLLSSLFQISIYMKNWYEIPLLYAGMKSEIVAKLAGGEEYRISGMEGYYIFRNCKFVPYYMKLKSGVDSSFKDGTLRLNADGKGLIFRYGSQRELADILSILYELFVDGEYSALEVLGRDVVDIGASFGDSAIYFSARGAKHVYAFELYPSSYALGVRNVAANSMKKRITFLNEGCGPRSGSILIDPKQISTVFGKAKSARKGKRVKISTLEGIVKRYKIGNGLLKVDCEGAEYEIILGAKDSTLKRFTQMIIEYHHGYRDLVERLDAAGFECTHTMPREMAGGAGERFEIGFIYASRVQ